MGSRRYYIRRVGLAVFQLVFVLLLNFILIQAAPGDPVRIRVRSEKLSAEDQARLIREFGLDKSMPEQFVAYLGETAQGNLGQSFISSRPVAEVIAGRIWPTLLLVGIATILSTVFGIWFGIVSAWRRGTKKDVALTGIGMVFYSMPDFWLGMMLLIVFASVLGWFPVGGFETSNSGLVGVDRALDIGQHLFLPCITLAVGYVAEYQLIMRSSLIDVMAEDFVHVARAKGLTDTQVRRRHAIPNALLPTVTMVILYFGYIVGGAIGVEIVFSYPGLGELTQQAIEAQDIPLQQGLLMILASVVILLTLFTNILYGYLDPRVREA